MLPQPHSAGSETHRGVSGMGLQRVSPQSGVGWYPQFFDLLNVVVEPQLDLSSVAARLRDVSHVVIDV
ncbi:hypothetical protein Taro_032440 [Colocasia esculenta]|uniref:Uncharacterized protein n=1 Tax=Colocasia esculenta TaxID=4460 RepID=A0A843W3X6_COLES|nr:hypothetical protein [Colocasia esculenta]